MSRESFFESVAMTDIAALQQNTAWTSLLSEATLPNTRRRRSLRLIRRRRASSTASEMSRTDLADIEDDDEKEKLVRHEHEQERTKARADGQWYRPRLYHFEDLPNFLQDNEYIHTGYRMFYTYQESWQSVFMVHNETGNIWTHGVGFFIFMAFMLSMDRLLPAEAHFFDHVAFALYFSCAGACLLFSTLFHTHYCNSRYAFVKFGCLDYAGISTLICGSCCLVIYLGYYCDDLPRIGWITTVILMASVGIIGPFYKRWADRSFRKWRTIIYISSGFASAIPVFYYLATRGFPEVDYLEWYTMIGLYLGGAAIYAFRVPETWWPGKFDLLFHSHQFWHTAVVLACYMHYRASLNLLKWRLFDEKCPSGL